jgi:hypothetical protein
MYQAYLSEREASDISLPYMPYGWTNIPETIDGSWMAFSEFIKEYSTELANEINSFRTYIQNLSAWENILKGCTDKEKMSILSEFVEPMAICALNHPYSVRSRFIYAVSHISHQANKSKEDDWKDNIKADASINFKEMEMMGSCWESFVNFKESLSGLNNENYTDKLLNYRNKFNHRFPPLIELGLSGFVTRVKSEDGKISYGFGYTSPILISDAVPMLVEQHASMTQSFDAFKSLVTEQVDHVFKT